MAEKPPVVVAADWIDGLAFTVRSGVHEAVIDGDSERGLSPVQMLGVALVGCMATDVALILTRGRQPLRTLNVTLTGRRADHDPHRLLAVDIHFAVGGDVDPAQLERAIALSREKYCSVWHSLREDIALQTTTSIEPAA